MRKRAPDTVPTEATAVTAEGIGIDHREHPMMLRAVRENLNQLKLSMPTVDLDLFARWLGGLPEVVKDSPEFQAVVAEFQALHSAFHDVRGAVTAIRMRKRPDPAELRRLAEMLSGVSGKCSRLWQLHQSLVEVIPAAWFSKSSVPPLSPQAFAPLLGPATLTPGFLEGYAGGMFGPDRTDGRHITNILVKAGLAAAADSQWILHWADVLDRDGKPLSVKHRKERSRARKRAGYQVVDLNVHKTDIEALQRIGLLPTDAEPTPEQIEAATQTLATVAFSILKGPSSASNPIHWAERLRYLARLRSDT